MVLGNADATPFVVDVFRILFTYVTLATNDRFINAIIVNAMRQIGDNVASSYFGADCMHARVFNLTAFALELEKIKHSLRLW